MLPRRRTTPLTLPLLGSIAGMVFSIWAARSTAPIECVTSGCTLFNDFTIAGVSLWWIGSGAFLLLAICAIFGRRSLGLVLAGLCLLGDIGLLTLMAFTAQCTNCLVVATLMAATFWAFRSAAADPHKQGSRSWLLFVWTLLFFSNLIGVANERMTPWIIHGKVDAPIRLYFSPSCPACRDAIIAFTPSEESVAFLPVAESPEDLNAIAVMQYQLAEGNSFFLSFRRATEASPRPVVVLSNSERLKLEFKLLRNKVRVIAAGSDKLPLIQMQGMPQLPKHITGHTSNAAVPLAPLQLDSCSGAPTASPCPEGIPATQQ